MWRGRWWGVLMGVVKGWWEWGWGGMVVEKGGVGGVGREVLEKERRGGVVRGVEEVWRWG